MRVVEVMGSASRAKSVGVVGRAVSARRWSRRRIICSLGVKLCYAPVWRGWMKKDVIFIRLSSHNPLIFLTWGFSFPGVFPLLFRLNLTLLT